MFGHVKKHIIRDKAKSSRLCKNILAHYQYQHAIMSTSLESVRVFSCGEVTFMQKWRAV